MLEYSTNLRLLLNYFMSIPRSAKRHQICINSQRHKAWLELTSLLQDQGCSLWGEFTICSIGFRQKIFIYLAGRPASQPTASCSQWLLGANNSLTVAHPILNYYSFAMTFDIVYVTEMHFKIVLLYRKCLLTDAS